MCNLLKQQLTDTDNDLGLVMAMVEVQGQDQSSRSKVKFKMSFFYWRGVVDSDTLPSTAKSPMKRKSGTLLRGPAGLNIVIPHNHRNP